MQSLWVVPCFSVEDNGLGIHFCSIFHILVNKFDITVMNNLLFLFKD